MTDKELDLVPSYYQYFVKLVSSQPLRYALSTSSEELIHVLDQTGENSGDMRYADGKWSIKEIVNHLMDSERVFCYRALRFARNDKTELSGFEQDNYVTSAKVDARKLSNLKREFKNLRETTIDLFCSFDIEMLQRSGAANGVEIQVKALAYVIAGHTLHHAKVIQDKYLQK